MADLTVATEIYRQLGGDRFKAMTGASNLGGDSNSLSMHLPKNLGGVKYFKVTLMPNDTYTLRFSKAKKTLDKEMSKLGIKIYDTTEVLIAELENVYAQDLQRIFTEYTKLHTKL